MAEAGVAIDIAAVVVIQRGAADRVAQRQGVLQQRSYYGDARAEGRLPAKT